MILRTLLVAALVLFAPILAHAGGLPRGDTRAEGFDPAKLDKIASMLNEAVSNRQIAGGAALLARHGKTVYLATAGQRDAEANLPITEDTIYRIASMTKPITSTAVMMLYDEGKLKLDDPLSKFIPEFKNATVFVPGQPNPAPAQREITIHHVLTHTSGITYKFFDRPGVGKLYAEAGVSDGLIETPGAMAENAKRIAKAPLLHQPGSSWEYGLNTDVLGRVVEVVSGQTLDEFFRERIFTPLKMDDTSFIVPPAKRNRLSALYTPDKDKKVKRVGVEPMVLGPLTYSSTYSTNDASTYFSGGAGLCSTIGDYARFLQMLLNRGELDGVRLLKPETVDLMSRNQIGDMQIGFPNHGDAFGYGFGVLTERGKTDEFKRKSYDDVASVGTISWAGIFNTFFWVDRERQLIGVLMTQLHPSDHTKLPVEFKRLTYDALSDPQASLKPDDYIRFARTSKGDSARGRILFNDTNRLACVRCHRVKGNGGDVGPDLTDIAGKFGRDQLIESVIEPSRQIVEGYRPQAIALKDGRTLTGLIKDESADELTLVTVDATKHRLKKSAIEERGISSTSIMPVGLAAGLTTQEFTDVIAYLESLRPPGQNSPGSGISGPLTLPRGFKAETIATGITGATALEIAPDGRIFICEQTGALRVVKNGRLLERPFATFEVDSQWERGLIGVCVDPDFSKNGYIYVTTVAKSPYPHHRILRLAAQGDVAKPGSEVVLFEGDDQTKVRGSMISGHQGGALHFGTDGKLYIALGEQTAGIPAQQMDSLLGKMLRLNSDGSIPDDNPFAKTTQGKYRAIWALGLRNPFTFAAQPGTGRIFINDVGNTKWEEVNEGFAGANYGWPTEEGRGSDPHFRQPLHHYPVASVSGGAFCPTDRTRAFPAEYSGQYFFMDFVKGWVKVLDPNSPNRVQPFASGLRRPVDLRFGPDGALYVLLRDAWVIDNNFHPSTGSLVRISYEPKPATPSTGINISEVIIHGDMDCFRVETPTATYLYGKRGAGFASIIDSEGHDWISYRPGEKARGEYRGLPKCGQPTKFFHCGYGYGQYKNDNPFTSTVTHQTPRHVQITSTSRDGKSSCMWDFFETHATFTLLKIDQPTFWFLYEGTPVGKLDAVSDFVIRPDGTKTTLDQPWSQVVPWVCFGASESPRGLVLVNHQPPERAEVDSYVSWPFVREADGSFQDMTVFGFGRKGYKELIQHVPDLKQLPAKFTIGFVEHADAKSATRLINELRSNDDAH